MKVPLRWLQEFIDLPTTDPVELSLVFDMVGHKVEGFEVQEPGWTDVVVGSVEGISAHPDADKIRVCQVDVGEGPVQIICGAWNFSEGARVAVARPGAMLPGGLEIGQRTIRGVESNGMICSEKELGLGEDHAGILVLDGDPQLGADFTSLVELPDVVFELEITPNRPDAMSMLGIARDLGAYLGVDHRIPEKPLPTSPGSTAIEVAIEDTHGCRRFTAREIRGVAIGRSPLRVRHRLAKAGVRSISNVVDVTNYVMVELGHPLHAFDADSIVGGKLVVKRAVAGEELETLDGETRALTEEDLIIYDDQGPTSMSGTMGGARSEVSASTTNVLMEAASWDPPTIMYMSRRHGLRSEASTRFERGVDPNLADIANQRASAMVVELASGAVPEGSIDVIGTRIDPVGIELPVSEVNRIIGPGLTDEEVRGILERLGMEVDGDDPLQVVVPTFRPDVTRPADLVEEVARIHGYDNFASTVPIGAAGGLTAEQKRRRRLQWALSGVGVHQAVTLPFVAEADVVRFGLPLEGLLRVKNPLREEEGRLRPSLIPGLLNAVRFNISRGAGSVALYETGLVFDARRSALDPRLPDQVERLAWAVAGDLGPQSLGAGALEAGGPLSLALMRHLESVLGLGDVRLSAAALSGYHPGRAASVELEGRVIGSVGELSPAVARAYEIAGRVGIAELKLLPLLAPIEAHQASSPSVFPPADFDLSFLIDSATAVGDLVATTTAAAGGLVESSHVFDVFTGAGVGEGERAVAIRYRLRAADRTLTNEEVAPVRQAMIDAASAAGARLRGA